MPAIQQPFRRTSIEDYKIDLDGDEDEQKEDRIRITKLLNKKTFGVFNESISKQKINDLPGTSTELINAEVTVSGMIWVECYCDGSDNTGQIEHGKPVCFDTVTGRCVTGINDKWSPGEYKQVGIAWKGFSGGSGPEDEDSFGRIPITLMNADEKPLILRARVYSETIDEDTEWEGEVEYKKDGDWSEDKIKIKLRNCQPLFRDEEILIGYNLSENCEWQVLRVMEEEHYCIASGDIEKGGDGTVVWGGPSGTEEIEIDVSTELGDIVDEDICIIRWILVGLAWKWMIVETECEEED